MTADESVPGIEFDDSMDVEPGSVADRLTLLLGAPEKEGSKMVVPVGGSMVEIVPDGEAPGPTSRQNESMPVMTWP